MSYGTSLPNLFRQVGIYVGRILNVEKAAELPIVQPTKFDMVINLKASKDDSHFNILLRADEVIE